MSNPVPPGSTNPPDPGTPPPLAGTPRPRVPVGTRPRPEADLATRLDGQGGWLNQLDRSLKKRSIVALVLTCLAVGVGAAALYISITRDDQAERVDALEARIELIEEAAAINGVAATPLPDAAVPETGTTDATGETPLPLPGTPAE